MGVGVSGLLTLVMGRRFAQTRKAMPAGLLFGASAIAFAFLLASL